MKVKIHFKVPRKKLYSTIVEWSQNNQQRTLRTPARIHTWPTVPDDIGGYYQFNNINNNRWVSLGANPNVPNDLTLVLLIESPHKDEFDPHFIPLRALNGSRTKYDNHICQKLGVWLNNPNPGTIIKVYLVNPIQYQTSLYHFLNGMIPNTIRNYNCTAIDRKMRNDVWRFLFDACHLKQAFIQRINAYNPDYIVNCCTGKPRSPLRLPVRRPSPKGDLKSYVRYELYHHGLINNGNYYEDIHPSIWL